MAKRDEQDLEVTDSTRPKKQQTRLKGWLALCCQTGEKPGYPRYRSRARYDRLAFKTFAYLSTGSRSSISDFSGKRNTTWPVRTAGSLEQRGGPKSERGGAR